jgi:metacaspase-1
MARGTSIHIGLNELNKDHYEDNFDPLNFCETDAENMADIAHNAGFTKIKLLAGRPRADAVIKAITDAAIKPSEKLGDGDILLVTFSGHGSEVPDEDGNEPFGVDQTWCLFDRQIIDDELARLWTLFDAGVRILFISDSCHSGTVAEFSFSSNIFFEEKISSKRGSESKLVVSESYEARLTLREDKIRRLNGMVFQESVYRPIIDDLKKELKKTGASSFKELIKASVISITACQDRQDALERDGNGIFTGSLKHILSKGVSDKNYQEFFDLVQQETLERNPNQKPNILRLGADNGNFEDGPPFKI